MQATSPLIQKFFRYAVPTVISAWIYAAYTLIDGIFIGRFVGETALAAFNLIVPLLSIAYAISVMVGVGGSTMVSRLLGEKKPKQAQALFTQAFYLLIVLGLGLSAIFGFGASFLAHQLGATNDLFPLAKNYLEIIAVFNTFATMGYALELFLRVDGAAHVGMYAFAMGGVVNIALDYLFIVVLQWGMVGAAFATGISYSVAALVMINYHLYFAKLVRFCRNAFSIGNYWYEMSFNGISEFLGELAPAVSLTVFNYVILKEYGQDGLVAFAILEYLTLATVVTLVALVQSMQPIISFENGAKNLKNMRAIFRFGLLVVFSLSLLSIVIILTQSHALFHLFVPEGNTESLELLSSVVFWYAIAWVPASINLAIAGYFTAIEAPLRSMIIALARSWVLLLGAIWVGHALFGAPSIWYSLLIAEMLTLFISISLLYRQKKSEDQYFMAPFGRSSSPAKDRVNG
jgi:putative MATE family efflux protein